MSKPPFSPGAAVLWGVIPDAVRKQILRNVFCVKCRQSVEITNLKGQEENGGLILKGQCAKCGREVVRVIEISAGNWERN